MTERQDNPKTFPGRPHDLVSYSGALLVYLAVTLWRSHGNDVPSRGLSLREVGMLLWSVHFTRRLLECSLVHRYADRRVPWGDAVGEYVYYWSFALWIGWALGSYGNVAVNALAWGGIAVFIVGEIGNGWAHLKLRALRPKGTTQRGIPRGGLFELVSSANYSYECLAWLGFCLATQRLAALVYFVGVMAILISWAKKRHARYLQLFDGNGGRPAYPSRRRALIPWVLLVAG